MATVKNLWLTPAKLFAFVVTRQLTTSEAIGDDFEGLCQELKPVPREASRQRVNFNLQPVENGNAVTDPSEAPALWLTTAELLSPAKDLVYAKIEKTLGKLEVFRYNNFT